MSFLLFLQQPDSLPVQKPFKPLDDNGEPRTLEHLLKFALSDYDWPGMFLNVSAYLCLSVCLLAFFSVSVCLAKDWLIAWWKGDELIAWSKGDELIA